MNCDDRTNDRNIILIVVFVITPIVLLWFCCGKGWCCFRRTEKRQHYNASVPGGGPMINGNYLVPINQFVPPDPKTGYAVRVDTPANPTEMAMPAPPIYHEITKPPRAATSGGSRVLKGLVRLMV
jgi:hypothetical protein